MTGAAGPSALVVGVDGSTAARAALHWAAEQAQRTGGRVAAIAVTEPRPLIAPGSGLAGGAMSPAMVAGTMPETPFGMADDEDVTAEADRLLSDALAALPAEAAEVVDPRAVVGDAADVLLEAARGADLLVLGNHRRGALTGALVGSVAQHCVRHAACPLVLVPAPESPAADDCARGTGPPSGGSP